MRWHCSLPNENKRVSERKLFIDITVFGNFDNCVLMCSVIVPKKPHSVDIVIFILNVNEVYDTVF